MKGKMHKDNMSNDSMNKNMNKDGTDKVDTKH